LRCAVLTTGMPEEAFRRLRPCCGSSRRSTACATGSARPISQRDRGIVAAALDRIEQERQGRTYLVGETFSVADLTAAALLAPLVQPPELQYPLEVELPSYVEEYRAALRQHPAMQWAADIYHRHRGRSAEKSRHVAP
jgi:glutathione S-transferase